MQIDKRLWERAVHFAEECKRRGVPITRTIIQQQFGVKQFVSRFLVAALENLDIIQFQPSQFSTVEGETELILTDLHCPYHDRLALTAALDFAEKEQPSVISLLGDVIDFYQISTFVRNPIKARVGQELVETKAVLTEIRERFPNARIIYKEGNHEDRWWRYIYSQAKEIHELVDDLFTTRLGLHDLQIEYQKQPYRIGKLWHMHGHEHMSKTYSPEHITNIIWKYVHDHFIAGHYHRSQEKTYKRGLSGETFWGGALGYMAGHMDYATINQWNQGFAIARYNREGNFRVEMRQVHSGEVF